MSPLPLTDEHSAGVGITNEAEGDPFARIRQYSWIVPQLLTPILLMAEPRTVEKYLAQMTGNCMPPAVFSLGWATYSFKILLGVIGGERLLSLPPDGVCSVMTDRPGRTTNNTSWIIGRMMRDYPNWRHDHTKREEEAMFDQSWKQRQEKAIQKGMPGEKVLRPTRVGISIAAYRISTQYKAGVLRRDRVYWIGWGVAVLQHAIATIPASCFQNYIPLLITALSWTLITTTACLPQWTKEKFDCRKTSEKTFVMVPGNGPLHAQNVIVILPSKDEDHKALGFTDLAAGGSSLNDRKNLGIGVQIILAVIAMGWVFVLILAGLESDNAWILLASCLIGTAFTSWAAGVSRDPSTAGIHLEFVETVVSPKIMPGLYSIEQKYPRVGQTLPPLFFSDFDLREDEKTIWAQYASASAVQSTGDECTVQQRRAQHQSSRQD